MADSGSAPGEGCGCLMGVAAAAFFLWAFLDPMHSFFPSLAAALFLGVGAVAQLRSARPPEAGASERDPDGGGPDVEAARRRGRVSRFLVMGGLIGAALSLMVGFPLQNRHHSQALRDRAALAAARSDLRNLLSAQESYYGEGRYTYTGDPGALDLTPSRDVTIVILSATENGFSATATTPGGSAAPSSWATLRPRSPPPSPASSPVESDRPSPG